MADTTGSKQAASHLLRTTEIVALACIATGIASMAAIRLLGDEGTIAIPLLIGGLILAALAITLPAQWVPSLALIVFAFVPVRLVPSSGLFALAPAISIILFVWVVRKLLTRSKTTPKRMLAKGHRGAFATCVTGAVVLIVWSLFTLTFSDYPQSVLGWTSSLVVGALSTLLVRNAAEEAHLLTRTFITSGAILGGYAIIEGLLHTNFFFGTIYSMVGANSIQHWSVYRSEASFGHPLFAGTFFAIAGAMAVAAYMQQGQAKNLWLGAFSIAGLVFTVSRGQILAAAIAITVTFCVWLISRGERRLDKVVLLVGLAGIALFIVVEFSALLDRGNSTEAMASNQARDRAWNLAFQVAADHGWMGAGAGSSGAAVQYIDENTVIENSALQLLVSVGILGVIAFFLIMFGASIFALASQSFSAFAGLFAYGVAALGYNAIERRSALVLLGLLLVVAFHSVGVGRSLSSTTDSLSRPLSLPS